MHLQQVAGLFKEERTHLAVLTGIRGWAVLWVFVYHLWGASGHPGFGVSLEGHVLDLTPLASMGLSGVTIFFVLSGFLLAIPYAEWQAGQRKRPDIGHYLFRRVMRVFPAYYVQLALLLVLAVLIPGQGGIGNFPDLFRHLFMLFMPPPLGMTPINLVWWTLPIEFLFYLALPLLAFVLSPRRWWWLLGGSLLAMALWRHFLIIWLEGGPIAQRVYAAYQLPGVFDMFGIGMLAALIYVHRDRLPGWLVPHGAQDRLLLLGLTLVFSAIFWLPPLRSQYWADFPIFYLWTPALSLGVAAIVYGAATGSRLAGLLFGNAFMIYAGLVSYSYYLWHLRILDWIAGSVWYQSVPGHKFFWLLSASVPTVFVVASLSYALIELPAMRFRKVWSLLSFVNGSNGR